MDEGVIKFTCNWTRQPLNVKVAEELLLWRDKMHELGLIGVYPEINIGYGNISVKHAAGMLISGSQTGHVEKLPANQYALVTEYSIGENALDCLGEVKASAESLTHLAFYEAQPDIKAIIHIHSASLWHELMDKVPTSGKSVPYGTPEMAYEIKRLFKETDISAKKIMVMGGHDEGLIAFGKNMEEAGEVVLRYCQNR